MRVGGHSTPLCTCTPHCQPRSRAPAQHSTAQHTQLSISAHPHPAHGVLLVHSRDTRGTLLVRTRVKLYDFGAHA
eukprot:1975111-Rhodomonas_salina.2